MLEFDIARRAARAGGDVLVRHFREGTVARRNKQESYNLVSDADVQAEQAIVGVIRQAFSDHAVLGEETHRDDTAAEHLWVIDPLDGTNNFLHRIPHFAVSIAYYRAGQAMCGVVFNPVRDDWYEAARGGGSTYNGEQVQVAEDAQLNQVLVTTGFYYDRGAMMEATLTAIRDLFRKHIHGIRRMGTASLDLAMVGTGQYGAFFEYQLAPWDCAAGALFVEEAGGKVTTCLGEPLPLADTSILATNGKLHEAVLEVVKAHVLT